MFRKWFCVVFWFIVVVVWCDDGVLFINVDYWIEIDWFGDVMGGDVGVMVRG